MEFYLSLTLRGLQSQNFPQPFLKKALDNCARELLPMSLPSTPLSRIPQRFFAIASSRFCRVLVKSNEIISPALILQGLQSKRISQDSQEFP